VKGALSFGTTILFADLQSKHAAMLRPGRKKEGLTGSTTGAASTSGGNVMSIGALTDLRFSAAAAVPEPAILEVNEVGCTVIYEGEEPLLAE